MQVLIALEIFNEMIQCFKQKKTMLIIKDCIMFSMKWGLKDRFMVSSHSSISQQQKCTSIKMYIHVANFHLYISLILLFNLGQIQGVANYLIINSYELNIIWTKTCKLGLK